VQATVAYFLGMSELAGGRTADASGARRRGAATHASEIPSLGRRQSVTEVVESAGSPTFAVDGVDLFPVQIRTQGLSCRVYLTDAGPAGVPTVADLVAALRDRTAS
jgi:hypothetical protein